MSVHEPRPTPRPDGAAVLALVRSALEERSGTPSRGPLIVGVDGRSGSGKSELAADLASRLAAEPGLGEAGAVVVLALEDAYRGWHGLAVGVGAVASGVLEPLSRGLPGKVRAYDWHRDALGELLQVPAPGDPLPAVVVLEGCGAGSAVCAPFLDVLVWLDAPTDVRRERALARDDGSWAHLWDAWAAQERALLEARDARAAADLVLRTG